MFIHIYIYIYERIYIYKYIYIYIYIYIYTYTGGDMDGHPRSEFSKVSSIVIAHSKFKSEPIFGNCADV